MIGCSNTNTVKIGYEQDEGNIIDINSGDVESTNVIKFNILTLTMLGIMKQSKV